MAQRARANSEALKIPHTVSLKVLRLSRPSFATQHPFPNSKALGIAPTASLAYPSPNPTTPQSILSPVLNLPEAFGSAYVGENFSCTLCANNELDPEDKTKSISSVRIHGEMQTPSSPSGTPLELLTATADGEEEAVPGPGESLQRILRFELKEEGNHVLAVTVTYTEAALIGEGKAASGRVRTFRKLYQFIAQQLLAVRTKAGEVGGGDGKRFLLEAQLENMGEAAISLESVTINPKQPFTATSLNWDMHSPEPHLPNAPVLNPRDVIQVAFLLEDQIGDNAEGDELEKKLLPVGDTRKILGQLGIDWRSALGDRGKLSTGWLTSRR